MQNKAVLVLNGEPPSVARLRELSEAYPVYAADGGAWACMEAGIRPVWVAGDLDSALREQIPEDWEVHVHPEQDRTDFQKVIGDLPTEVEDIRILGGMGRRVDHQWTNLMISAALPEDFQVVFEQGREVLTRVTSRCPFAGTPAVGDSLSLLPLPRAEGVTTGGLRWNLDQAVLEVGGQLGQSNEVTGPVRITVQAGSLFVWQTPEFNNGTPK